MAASATMSTPKTSLHRTTDDTRKFKSKAKIAEHVFSERSLWREGRKGWGGSRASGFRRGCTVRKKAACGLPWRLLLKSLHCIEVYGGSGRKKMQVYSPKIPEVRCIKRSQLQSNHSEENASGYVTIWPPKWRDAVGASSSFMNEKNSTQESNF